MKCNVDSGEFRETCDCYDCKLFKKIKKQNKELKEDNLFTVFYTNQL